MNQTGRAALVMAALAAVGIAAECRPVNLYEGQDMAPKRTRKEAIEFSVSPKGNDKWSGASPEPEKGDGPFATLERARDAIRALKAKGPLPAGGVTVWLGGGDYVIEKTFALSEKDSGAKGAPVVYRAAEGENVRLLGGRAITDWAPVKDKKVLERLPEDARRHVVQADLKAHGVADFGRLQSRGFGRRGATAHLELFFGGRPMTLARWPNDDFVKIAGIPEEAKHKDAHGGVEGELEAGFLYDGDRPKQWKSLKDVWVHGYWSWDWANSYEAIESYDPKSGLIKTKDPYGNYGFRLGQRFYFLNVLEELDSPGEYYVDTRAGILYLWPPKDPAGVEALVSVLEAPMISLKNASHVTIRGLTLEATRGVAIEVTGGADNLIAGCTLRNIGTDAIVVRGGENHAVVSCDMSEIGNSAIELTGGDRKTLKPCGHRASNNHIWRFSRWSRTYCPGVHFSGVGITVSHNLIHDAPHTAILYLANESVIEFNEIHHVTLETGDCGAIYTGRDFTARGNVIRHNYIHDTGGYGMGSMGVYLDDCVSGQTIYGNLFVRCTRAAFIGGGRDVTVENNVFVDCAPAVHLDGRGLNPAPVWHDMVYKYMKERLDDMKHHEPPYSERYPKLKELDKYYADDKGVPPGGNVIERNVSVGGRWMDIVWGGDAKYLTIGENLVDKDPHFADPKKDDYRLKEDSPAWKMGFKLIPVDEIGLVEDEYRQRARKK